MLSALGSEAECTHRRLPPAPLCSYEPMGDCYGIDYHVCLGDQMIFRLLTALRNEQCCRTCGAVTTNEMSGRGKRRHLKS